jgi:hypothetical protein
MEAGSVLANSDSGGDRHRLRHTRFGHSVITFTAIIVSRFCGSVFPANCDTRLTSGDFGWVLALIEQDQAYAG